MIYLNFTNVEQLIFQDPELIKLLSSANFSYFEQWRLSVRIPYMREIGKQAMLDFLNNIEKEDLELLESYFDEKILVEKLNYNTTFNLKIPLNGEECKEVCQIAGFNYFSTWRDEVYLYITYWR